MKRLTLLFATIGLLAFTPTHAQPDSLIEALQGTIVSGYDESGLVKFYPEAEVQPGSIFTLYEQVYGEDEHNEMVLERQWTSEATGMTHYRYRQYHDDIPVQAAKVNEHTHEDGYVLWAAGKVASDLQTPEVWMTESEALAIVLDEYPENEFAWEDEGWEQQIKDDMDDEDATFYPEGELMFTIDNYANLGYIIPSDRYTLAWRFDVFSLGPYFHKAIYVDALNGNIFREDDLVERNGPANIHHHGEKTIDTDWKGGPLSGHILKTNNAGRNIHTKQYNYRFANWGSTKEVKDSDDDWGTSHHGATAPHWFASECWDYFNETSYTGQRNGMDNQGSVVRVQAEGNFNNAYYTMIGGKQYIQFGEVGTHHGYNIDVVGHEFTHGVVATESGLESYDEPGALKESYCDIFGFMIEMVSEQTDPDYSYTLDWIIGEDEGGLTNSLADPKSDFIHYTNSSCSTAVGQPDTYGGDHWYTPGGPCDAGGKHVNAGVQNHWFYLLSHGGSGTNDNNDSYNVTGIGYEDAAFIAYETMTMLDEGDGYAEARANSIAFAENQWGSPCEPEVIAVTNAWAAVGVGSKSNCQTTTSEEFVPADRLQPVVYPNPAYNHVNVNFLTARERTVEILSPDGKVVSSRVTGKKSNQLDVSGLATGIYYIRVEGEHQAYTTKFVKW